MIYLCALCWIVAACGWLMGKAIQADVEWTHFEEYDEW